MSQHRWSNEKAWKWFHQQGYRQGFNFLPSTASNVFEMWQTPLDVGTIQRELQWASEWNYNAARVFLHNLMYQHEGDKFLDKVEIFLDMASSSGIKVMLVLFDGCWDPHPKYGPQLPPRPHVHNSRWVQAPGAIYLSNLTMYASELRQYVKAVVSRFANDTQRVLAIDLFNEPDNTNDGSYGLDNVTRVPSSRDAFGTELKPRHKKRFARQLVRKTFEWSRALGPLQVPLTVGVWGGETNAMRYIMRNNSDIISFHTYGSVTYVNGTVQHLANKTGRPLVCTEYMARNTNSTFDPVLGFLKQQGVWAMNWGLVAGKSQTNYPWDSWQKNYTEEPELWQHDVMYHNGTSYLESEKAYVQSLWKRSLYNDWRFKVGVGSLVLVIAMVIAKMRRWRLRSLQYRQVEVLE